MIIHNIGIVGQGFVGSAVKTSLSKYYSVHTFDTNKEKSCCDSLNELISISDLIFVCLPTPMKRSGECDISLVEETLSNISKTTHIHQLPVLIKSTVPPGTCENLSVKYNNLNIIFNPEFLTEANAVEDYMNQKRVILGVGDGDSTGVFGIFNKAFPTATIIKTKRTVAEMVKYVTNCFLSVKVSFANEMYEICDKLGVDYDKVIEYAKYDNRLGYSHWNVPGPDGHFGYGGHCFPKDIAALKYVANKNSIDSIIIDAAIAKNDKVRQERDWEKQIGRAVVKDFNQKE